MKKLGIIMLSFLLSACGQSEEEPEMSKQGEASPVDVATVVEIIQKRCASCHSETPTDDVFKSAPSGVFLETLEQMQRWSPRIHARAVATQSMPFMNKTQMTLQERELVGQWIKAGSP